VLHPSDVVYLFVVIDELGFNDDTFDVLYGVGGVDAWGVNSVRVDVIPIKRGEKGANLNNRDPYVSA